MPLKIAIIGAGSIMPHEAALPEPAPTNAERADDAPLLPTYSDDGVDLTLIRWMLSLSPVERLRTAQRYATTAQRLRNAPRRIRL